MDMFNFKITIDRHNAIQNLNYYDLPDPPRFSLPSTFNYFMLINFLRIANYLAVTTSQM
jgi:hypothetical protein